MPVSPIRARRLAAILVLVALGMVMGSALPATRVPSPRTLPHTISIDPSDPSDPRC